MKAEKGYVKAMVPIFQYPKIPYKLENLIIKNRKLKALILISSIHQATYEIPCTSL
jgi:hypothetical protein